MSLYFFNNVPAEYLDKFCAVRDAFSNLENLLVTAEILNTCHESWNKETKDFDLLISTGTHKRILVKKTDGFFTMNLPFQVIEYESNICFNYDAYALPVNAEFISRCRNVIATCGNGSFSYEAIAVELCDNFDRDIQQAINYCDAISSLLLVDHGYFRFDDDLKNARGKVHPRYHFDFFCNNSTNVKIGSNIRIGDTFFLDLFDVSKDRPYLT
ncbi:hypothetical protein EAF89_09415 [Salmonella enterica]|uniref:Cytoplasmic protein n=26 Tax=Salmonella enterica TaxID=28901 RepID=Q8ZMN8_SALTY|nr:MULTISPECIES: hypothetical protein [Salmonella]NP_461693.1 putative cytoplasmic protein [Salmonella enterica subsp. enterica serovar Typhimurium str. LT2]AGK10400.1 putative cytoplasmic protein [Salmonella enterica subsp. enterica serovar Typhimurium str. U288]AJR16862.1 putative cytoplasmic protein [Salmonella enterica subsp. enterica serovar 4,5:i:-]EAA0722480.1 hypothetical protein [Salmonella enterica subsp. enterica serovar Coeln]EAA7866674.1 hypothetical protein [Salmonella enterica s